MSDKTRRYSRFVRPNLHADIGEEMEFHIAMLADKYVAQGVSPDAARQKAILEFGDLARAQEQCMEIGENQLHASERAEVLGNLGLDLRHAARRLVANPVFAIVTILTLAIGIGPNIAIFSIINSVLLAPLPYPDQNRLVYVQETFAMPNGGRGSGSVSWGNWLDWRSRAKSFSSMGIASFTGSVNLGGADRPERLSVSRIGASLFPTLGVRLLIGRSFTEEETSADGPNVVVISENLWRRKFDADPAILGKMVTLDATPFQIIGVMPANVIFPNRSAVLDAWVPLQVKLPPAATRGSHAYMVVGRLGTGVTEAQALAEMQAIAANIAREVPNEQEGRSATIVSLRDTLVGRVRPQLLILLGAASLVLLIACANAGSLLLARSASRQREVAVLAALGATRGRIAQQFLVESLLLTVLGAIAGLALGAIALKGIILSAGTMLPRAAEIHFDGRVILFVAAIILLTTLLFGLVPALRATRPDLQQSLREGGRGETSGRRSAGFRQALVVTQFALSLVLLARAGLLLRTFASLLSAPTGMQPENVLTIHVPVPVGSAKYPTAKAAVERLSAPLVEQVGALPGVKSVGYISLLPLQQWGANGNFQIVGKSYASTAEQPFAEFRVVSPGYFSALGIPILRGRDILESDDSAAVQVVLVNEQTAKKFFPGEDALGKQLQFGLPSPTNPPNVIVGIVGDVRQASLDAPSLAELYFPYRQNVWAMRDMVLVVRTTGDAKLAQKSIETAARKIDPDQPLYDVRTMEEVMARSVADRRLYLRLLGAFAAIALVLAMAGIYGVMSYAVTQRTREFGIRLALGSEISRIQGLVVWSGARLAVVGLVIGLPAAVLTTKLLRDVLYGVAPGDPVTLGVVALVLAVVALLASYVPARRVARVDPIIAMRAE